MTVPSNEGVLDTILDVGMGCDQHAVAPSLQGAAEQFFVFILKA